MVKYSQLNESQKEKLKSLRETSVFRSLYAIILNWALITLFSAVSIYVLSNLESNLPPIQISVKSIVIKNNIFYFLTGIAYFTWK